MRNTSIVSPWKSLLWLLLFALVGIFVGSLFGVLVSFIIEGKETFGAISNLGNESAQNLNVFRIVQGGASLGMFLMPPVLLGYFENQPGYYIPQKGIIDYRLFLLTAVGTFALQPVIYLTAMLNEGMVLPSFLRDLEIWMRVQEETASNVVKRLLGEVGISALVSNLLVIAAFAAIGEEAFFRGGLQQMFYKIFKNPHVAIFVVSVIFSAIHLQFYGFLPRMLMGVFFGYLFYWTQNIWYPILAHFINNAGAVIQGFWIVETGGSIEELENDVDLPFYGYIIAIVILLLIFRQFSKIVSQLNPSNHGKELDQTFR